MTSPVCSEAISRTVRAETSLRGQQSSPGHAHGWRSARSSHLERPHPQSPAIRNGASTSNQQTDRHGSCTSVSRRQSDAHLRLEHTGVRHGARTSNDLAHNHLRFGTEPAPRIGRPTGMVHAPRSQGTSPTHTSDWNTQAFGTELAPRTTSPTITCDSERRGGARTLNQQTDQHGPRTSVSRRQSDAHLRLENTGVRHGARTSNDLAHNHLRFGSPWRSPHLESAD